MLDNSEITNDNASINIKVKTPKRIVHYGDGVVEEYSEDEIDSCQSDSEPQPEIDPVCFFFTNPEGAMLRQIWRLQDSIKIGGAGNVWL